MKIPKSWNDKSLLQDEPFLSAFKDHSIGKSVKGAEKELCKVVEALKEMDIDSTMEQWFKFIFFTSPGDGQNLQQPPPTDFAALLCFVRIYSYLARGLEGPAFLALDRERHSRGFLRFNDVVRYEEAVASYLAADLATAAKKQKKKSSTRPDGPYATRRLSSQITTTSLPLDISKRKGAQKEPLTRENGSSSKPARPTEQEHKILGKRSSDAPDDRPSKNRSIAKSQTGRQDNLARGKAYNTDRSQTLLKTRSRSNPPRSTRHLDQPHPPSRHDPKKNKLSIKKLSEHTSATHNTTADTQIFTAQRVSSSSERRDLEDVTDTVQLRQTPKKRTLDGPNDPREAKRRGAIADVDSNNVPESTNRLPTLPLVETCDTPREISVTNDIHTPLNEDNHRQRPANPKSAAIADYVKCNANGIPVEISSSLLSTKDSLPSTVPEDAQRSVPLCVKAESNPPARVPAQQPYCDPLPQIPYKKPLPELPPIWAQSRQEVCESFDWFRSYQGGVYHVHEMVKGYLLSGFPSSRDRFEHGGRLIISHGGGKAESIHTTKGQMSSHPASDQLAQDKSIRALLNNYRNGRPLALLIDDKYALFPYDLGFKDITYAVLGFYTVAHVWAEYQLANNEFGRVVRYKFAFRWCEDQGSPWWLTETEKSRQSIITPHPSSNGEELLSERICASIYPEVCIYPEVSKASSSGSSATAVCDMDRRLSTKQDTDSDTRLCTSCCSLSPRVFYLHWTCLVPECNMFWRQAEGPHIGLYISDLTYHPNFLKLPPHKPLPFGFQDAVRSLSKSDSGAGTLRSYHITRGFHCNKCGRLSSRSQWEKWECLNCHEYLSISVPLHFAPDIWNQTLPISYRDYHLNPISDIVLVSAATFIHDAGRGFINSFILPHNRGKIHHIQPGNPDGRREADKIFLDYQEEAASGTVKFRRWPLRAHKCRGSLLTNYFSHNAGEPYKYVGGDANTVPFQSAPAVCSARALIEKRVEQALNISIQFNEVLSAAYMERQKMAFHSDNEVGLGPVVAGLSLGSPALMHFRLHAKLDPEREKKGILMSIVLRHGDVLVMDGAGVQECYEHTVVPNNFRIAATARQIGVAHS